MTIAQSQDGFDLRQAIQETINEHGCYLAMFEPDNYLPGFAFTIGLFEKYGHPEIICFGLSTSAMGAILNHARDLIISRETLKSGKTYSGFVDGYKIQFIKVDKDYYQEYVGYAGWYYGNSFEFPLLQLIWPDKKHKFPWENGFNPNWKFKQPILDRDTDFKFYEERNLGVYTTQQVLDGALIRYVHHNEDGDWQFHASQEPDLADAKLVALEQITKLDPSINQIYHLQYGWRAWRESSDDDWQYEEDKNE